MIQQEPDITHEGQILRKLIKKHSSISSVADLIDVSRNTIGNWIDKDVIPVGNWMKIAQALRIPIADHVPRLKNHPETNIFSIYSDAAKEYLEDLGKVTEVVDEKNQMIADQEVVIQSLKQRIIDLEQIIESKNELIAALKS